MQLVKESLELTWSKYLSNDWLVRNKPGAVSFPVDKFFMDVEWEKIEDGFTGNAKMANMYDLLQVGNLTAANILMEGTFRGFLSKIPPVIP